ncbi:MAG: hypothetical protein JWO95_1651, partial [Verrucomicrobiales bacterium]|nr:hypothetical protein [Verrucomicrobiales bacterium]
SGVIGQPYQTTPLKTAKNPVRPSGMLMVNGLEDKSAVSLTAGTRQVYFVACGRLGYIERGASPVTDNSK